MLAINITTFTSSKDLILLKGNQESINSISARVLYKQIASILLLNIKEDNLEFIHASHFASMEMILL